jgi:hypothetical protein
VAQHSQISGTAITVSLVGAVLLYSAVKNRGISETVRSLLAGEPVADNNVTLSGVFPSASTIGKTGTYVPGGTVETQLKNSLLAGGLTKAQTAGVIANGIVESNLDPTNNTGDGGTSGGLFQWHLGRLDALKAWASAHGLPWTSAKAQIGYMWVELNTAYAPAQLMLRAQTTPEGAARVWDQQFEHSSGTTTSERETLARQIFESM